MSKTGTRRTVLVHIKKVSIDGGTVLFACRDVTERKAAEAEARSAKLELNHASRLALIGELVASIVHEVKQPLTSLAANADAGRLLLAQGQPLDQIEKLREILVDIHEQSRHTAAVIDRLRMLARKQAFELELLDVNDVLRELVKLVEGEAQRRGIALQLELNAARPSVSADRVCLRQIVLNLITNAMDALDEVERQRVVSVRTRLVNNGLEITVSDTGPGIAPERASRIFDPFYTTKPEGVGLGLALARSLAEAQAGQLRLADTGGGGTTFSLSLPRTPAASIGSNPT